MSKSTLGPVIHFFLFSIEAQNWKTSRYPFFSFWFQKLILKNFFVVDCFTWKKKWTNDTWICRDATMQILCYRWNNSSSTLLRRLLGGKRWEKVRKIGANSQKRRVTSRRTFQNYRWESVHADIASMNNWVNVVVMVGRSQRKKRLTLNQNQIAEHTL